MDIRAYLCSPETQALRFLHRDALPSTNTALVQLAQAGEPEGLVLTADSQSAGRGRLGRSFLSPVGGLYLSLLLRPRLAPEDTLLLTAAACTAVCRAIRDTLGLHPEIKWVNDLYLDGKKVCGILAEGQLSPAGAFDFVVLGIGLNLGRVPETVADIAGSLGCGVGEAPRLAAAILDRLLPLYSALPDRAFLADYRAMNLLPGKTVRVLSPTGAYTARVLAVTDRGGLLVETETGLRQELESGEVSLKMC